MATITVTIDPEVSEARIREIFSGQGLVTKHVDRHGLLPDGDGETRRNGKVLVPAAGARAWTDTLLSLRFVISAELDTSEYRLNCENHGGVVRYSRSGSEFCVDLPLPSIPWESVLPDEREECERVSGEWHQYRSTCVESCDYDKNDVCGTVITPACRCGAGRCWIGKRKRNDDSVGTCIAVPAWVGHGDVR
jgi:hypothetical protein